MRLSALGDVCNLVPAVRALQRRYPQARITWVIGRAEHSLLAGLSGVEFIVFDKRTGLAGMRAVWRQLKGRRFDVLLHMQVALRASLLSLGIKAQRRIGFDRARSRDAQHWFVNEQLPDSSDGHVIEGFFDFMRLLGVSDCHLHWDIPVPESAEQQRRRWVEGAYWIISPCSSDRAFNYRNWTSAGYAALIDYARDRYGLKAVLTGGGSDQEQAFVRDLVAQCQSPVINTLGQTDLKTLLVLIRDAVVVMAPDSGPIHMAAAMGTAPLGLYATSNPQRTGPVVGQQYVVNKYPEAVAQCLGKPLEQVRWGQRVRDPKAMALIQIDDVKARLDAIMASPQSAPEQD